jgi:hypothetical protein
LDVERAWMSLRVKGWTEEDDDDGVRLDDEVKGKTNQVKNSS